MSPRWTHTNTIQGRGYEDQTCNSQWEVGSGLWTGDPLADTAANCSSWGKSYNYRKTHPLPLFFIQNGEFHQTIQELLQWLEATTATIKEAEPVDLSVSKTVLQTKYNKFLELQKDLQKRKKIFEKNFFLP